MADETFSRKRTKGKPFQMNCVVCQKQIEGYRHGRKKYCSGSCAQRALKARRRKFYEIQCPQCGAEITSSRKHKKFCSEKCARLANYGKHQESRVRASSEYTKNNRAKVNERIKVHYHKNRDRLLEKARQWKDERHSLYPWERLIDSARGRAKQKKIDFDLTNEWGCSIWTGKCAISGIDFKIETGTGAGPKIFSPSIDRIDSTKGYTQANCRFVLMAVNGLKHNGTDEQMLMICKAILDRNS